MFCKKSFCSFCLNNGIEIHRKRFKKLKTGGLLKKSDEQKSGWRFYAATYCDLDRTDDCETASILILSKNLPNHSMLQYASKGS